MSESAHAEALDDDEASSSSRRSPPGLDAPSDNATDLRRSRDGQVWFLQVTPDEAWVAVPQVGTSGGGGWFRCDSSLDPASSEWAPVSGSVALSHVRRGLDKAAELTAQMVGSCIADGLGLEALELADSLLDQGYTLDVTATRSGRTLTSQRTGASVS